MRPKVMTSLLGISAAVALTVACDAGGAPIFGGLGAEANSLIVFGLTTSNTGAPVVASVRVIAEDSTCSGASFGEADVTSSNSGVYRVVISSSKSGQPMCVVVKGMVVGTADTTTVIGPVVMFVPGDSAQVNIPFP